MTWHENLPVQPCAVRMRRNNWRNVLKDGSFKSFLNGTAKLLAKETKWTSLKVRTQNTFLENSISKYDFGPVKLPSLSRTGPLPRENVPEGESATYHASLFLLSFA